GTEQRGPQNVNGGHTPMGHADVVAIAEKLGEAVAAPVLPFSVNRARATPPGTIRLTGPPFAQLNQPGAEQLVFTRLKNVVLMGEHGGGQNEMKEVATKLDAKHAPDGVHVYFCGEVYEKANGDFDKWLVANGYPSSSHAGIPDTSEMMYLGGDKGWTRPAEIPNAVGDPVQARGTPRDPNAKRVNNGITGDARKSTAELGKKIFDMKVDYAVRQIQGFLAGQKN